MPGSSVLHYSPNFVQIHVHRVGDAIQPPHPLSPSSPFAFNLSQNQGLFQWVGSSHQVAQVLELQLEHQSFQGIFRINILSSLAQKIESINSSAQLKALSILHGPTLTSTHNYWKNHQFSSVQSLCHVQLFATPKDCSTPGSSVLHYLPELAQTDVHWVSDAIQPSHPVSPPSPPAHTLPSIAS